MLNHKFKLAAYGGEPSAPLSLSRVFGPLLALSREQPQLEIVPAPNHVRDWSWLAGCDGLFLEHAYTPADLQVVTQAYRLGLPIWLDWGDDMFSVDKSNAAWLSFANVREIKLVVAAMLQLADVVTTATPTLRKVYQDLLATGPDQAVINDLLAGRPDLAATEPVWRGGKPRGRAKFIVLPEAVPLSCPPPATAPRRKVITWRGLASHADDLVQHQDALIEVLRGTDWTLVVFGDPAITSIVGNALGDTGVKLMTAPWYDSPWGMLNAWDSLCPFLHLCPLPDTPFNRGRPPSAWLEASAVGAAVLCPEHLPEWDVPGMIRYHDGVIQAPGKPNFTAALRLAMAEWSPVSVPSQNGQARGALHPNVAAARAAIYPAQTLPVVNKIRWEIIEKMRKPETLKAAT